MGARFVPCMHETASYPVDGAFQCPNMTDVGQNGTSAPIFTPTQTNVTINGSPCTLQEVCGMTEFKDPSVPDQWYRFLSAIFYTLVLFIGYAISLFISHLVQVWNDS